MALMFLAVGLLVVTHFWLCFRVGRSSVPLAIATFVFGPVAALYTLFKHHGDEDTSITLPFVANVVCTVVFIASAWSLIASMLSGEPSEAEMQAVAAAMAQHQAATGGAGAAPVAPAPDSPAAPAPAAPVDPVEAYSTALQNVGISHTVTRLTTDASKLPAGVLDAALVEASTAPQAVAASAPEAAASEPAAPPQISATFLRCESPAVCRDIAGAYMQQDAKVRPRVLQNGALLLLMPPSATAASGDFDVVPAAMASVFRKQPH